MDKIIVKGPARLSGEVEISPAKNACLPILAAILLTDKKVTLTNLPQLRDINTMLKLLEMMGVQCDRNGKDITFDASTLSSHEATYELVKTMRASIFVLGPLLSRLGKAKVSLPGGCAIGTRPIDIHLDNLEKMNVKIEMKSGYVYAETDHLKGAHVKLKFPSVGATENLIMAGVFADGQTIIENAAMEPEIDDLANFLNSLGAKVSGIGTSRIVVDGVKELNGGTYQAIGDRIEAATYIIGGLMTKSEVTVKNFNPKHLFNVLENLQGMGAKLEIGDDFVKTYPSSLKGSKVITEPFPGFPTDVQAQMVALLTVVEGNSLVTENIFENRFMHVPELTRLGASIEQLGSSVFIEGGKPLTAAPVMCTDLRASAALVLAALCAYGETKIDRVYHLQRGYEDLPEKLKKLGASVELVNE
ncbi:UDP-N-acetylglucosamine 1-carboxyvinyltransferase [Halobacteriovorax sp. GFR7]|uniref:UDP-N-acetylglucosamine 1-carboxyvinyltransferase n=1 Tax=unclassified Halobacteriovorax TaxID=2639665 RepID=UPI0037241D2B